jgi:hypothetical protein
MVTLATILDLPPDDDEAFLAFEDDARQTYEQCIQNAHHEEPWAPFRLVYMTHVRAAAEEFGVESIAAMEVLPPITSEEFDQFQHEVLTATTRLKFRVARRLRNELIEPNTSDREKIKFRVRQLRDQIDESALSQAQKDALNSKLNELEQLFQGKVVNRAAVLVVLAAVATLITQAQGIVLKGPETVVAVMDTINIVIGKEEERRLLLERYRKPLAIEDNSKPQTRSAREEFAADLDDEIPF